MRILVTICARGGSKGIPGKNIKPLNDVPLIAYTIRVAQEFAKLYNADIAISTDDAQIKNVACEYGILTEYVRPEQLATDSAGKIDTILDLLLYQESNVGQTYDYLLDLDVTSPLRTLEDIVTAFELLKADEEALNLFSVNNAARNPYFNMVEQKENGYYDLVKREGAILTRQSAPKVYDLNASFYFYKRKFFSQGLKTVFTQHSLIYLMPHLCFDLDHVIDFEFLDFLLSNNKLDFSIWKY
ncbi:acylneuraminate cytidylyltransferase family protein [Mucilaginibacter sp.]|uniref:acylneuraminate cytidylyltransferase family protein n=1 Tax=Mucilaginibacter sp. TaxID=1882438 RepID=UPI00262DC047|nr:acylneuraminate cytidylyltransferase family protein [Mucilaginibacter sp.]MDB4921088.1 N-acylneuraminate cytidylyltransferase [Mucilaginibacter sp.]